MYVVKPQCTWWLWVVPHDLMCFNYICWIDSLQQFDGASKGNPGISGCGATILDIGTGEEVRNLLPQVWMVGSGLSVHAKHIALFRPYYRCTSFRCPCQHQLNGLVGIFFYPFSMLSVGKSWIAMASSQDGDKTLREEVNLQIDTFRKLPNKATSSWWGWDVAGCTISGDCYDPHAYMLGINWGRRVASPWDISYVCMARIVIEILLYITVIFSWIVYGSRYLTVLMWLSVWAEMVTLHYLQHKLSLQVAWGYQHTGKFQTNNEAEYRGVILGLQVRMVTALIQTIVVFDWMSRTAIDAY